MLEIKSSPKCSGGSLFPELMIELVFFFSVLGCLQEWAINDSRTDSSTHH